MGTYSARKYFEDEHTNNITPLLCLRKVFEKVQYIEQHTYNILKIIHKYTKYIEKHPFLYLHFKYLFSIFHLWDSHWNQRPPNVDCRTATAYTPTLVL